MKIFHCDHCDQLLFFENVQCLNCKRTLAYLPDVPDIASLEPVADKLWQADRSAPGSRKHRLCTNYSNENVCNWAIPENDPNELCESCRLNRIIPDLKAPGHRAAWARLENAKRRLIYTLLGLRLPLANKAEDARRGLAFEFMADTSTGSAPAVHTGHNEGVITINIAEADDVEREKRRHQLHEPYRTLLGHFRHEIGHYYWDRLIKDSDRLDGFRRLFGDEQQDYGQALQRHYQRGAPADWQQHFVSAYASSHPWEDWAEAWAHYLHMTDALETARACGLSMRPRRSDEPSLQPVAGKEPGPDIEFDRMIADWVSVSYLLNNLNRSLGQPDGYPFVLSAPVIEKTRFIHETIRTAIPLSAVSSPQLLRSATPAGSSGPGAPGKEF